MKADDRQSSSYRFLVLVKQAKPAQEYAEVVEVGGPRPHEAIKVALETISNRDNHLWMAEKLTVTLERVQ